MRITIYDGDEPAAEIRTGRAPEILSPAGQHAISLCQRPAFRYNPYSGNSRKLGLARDLDDEWTLTIVEVALHNTVYRVQVDDPPPIRPIGGGGGVL